MNYFFLVLLNSKGHVQILRDDQSRLIIYNKKSRLIYIIKFKILGI